MTRKSREEWRQRTRELAAKDRANRCAVCLQTLPVGHLTLWAYPEAKYCSQGCLECALERAAGDQQ